MGRHLDRARPFLGRDTSGFLEGGRYALVHTRSLEFDDLRPYVRGDDVRDIDWKASARSGDVLIKRFVSERHHKILVVADAGRNMLGESPSGEIKRTVAANAIGAVGLVTLRRSDEIGMVLGDARGCVDIRLRRGETHVEYLLSHFHDHVGRRPGRSDVVTQLDWVAEHYRRPHLVVVVSDEPEVDERLGAVLTRIRARHDVLWIAIPDHPAVGEDDTPGLDVTTGAAVLSVADLGAAVIQAYLDSEKVRREALSEFMTSHAIPHALITGSSGIRSALIRLTGVFARAG